VQVLSRSNIALKVLGTVAVVASLYLLTSS
jgi:hypothetical protein